MATTHIMSERIHTTVQALHDKLERLNEERHATEKETWWRTTSATIALLKHAQFRMDHAEKTIRTLEKRVKDLESISTHDELTGLLNRRGFNEALSGEVDRTKRHLSQGGVLVIIDLDDFKSINDTFGHSAGDACLRLVGKTLLQDIRAMDAAGRMGGDEFIVLLADADAQCAVDRAQKLGSRLNNISFMHDGFEIAINASVGLRAYGPNDNVTRIIADADASMYTNKKGKRNNNTQHRTISERSALI